jgi:teichuronic acid biosynthesis glycosyltransferase TuaC
MKVLVVTNMYPSPEKPAFGTFVKEQVDSLKREGVDIDVFLVDGSQHKINYLWGIFRFWAQLLRKRYDLIHAHYVFSGMIARSQFLYPVVLTHHGLEVFTGWQRFPARLLTPLIDRAILVSEEQKRRLGCRNVAVIPCGVDMDFFKPIPKDEARRQLNLRQDEKLALWVGNHLRPEKRFDIVQAAVALAQAKDPSIKLVLVSGQPHEVVSTYMSASDALLLVSNGEGSPMAVKEAMACNLPVVSVPVGDVPEVIGSTEGCYLCSQDPADVAEKLLLALSRPGRTSGREKIGNFEEGAIARRIIRLYQEIINERKIMVRKLLVSRRSRRIL